jgi:FkbM family methyltransferase
MSTTVGQFHSERRLKRTLRRLRALRYLVRGWRRWSGRELRLSVDAPRRLCRVGDCEGGWAIDPTLLPRHPLVYDIGIGSDVSFDLELVRAFGSSVVAFDPTPGCVEAAAAAGLGQPAFALHAYAVSDFDGVGQFRRVLRRGRPTDCWTLEACDATAVGEISYPSMNVRVVSVTTALRAASHRLPDVLKIDAEGTEYRILDALLRARMYPTQLLVEFHHSPVDPQLSRTRCMLEALGRAGYVLAYISDIGSEYTFLRRDAIDGCR